jgi:UDP-N-acetylmuramate dehydrogenase
MTALRIEQDVSLAAYTSLELGGPAQYFADITSRDMLREALSWARQKGLHVNVLGGGSNLIVSDQGVSGVTLRMATRGVSLDRASGQVSAQAGENWAQLVDQCVQAELSGIECLSGIPGSVGAAPIQNIGAYGQELSQCLQGVEVLDMSSLDTRWVAPEACAFGYRQSRWKRQPGQEIVLAVQLALAPGAQPHVRYAELLRALGDEAPTPARVRERVLELRRSKSMLLEATSSDANRRSVGSFFLNPVVSTSEAARVCELARARGAIANDSELPQYPQPDGSLKLSAAWLIERSGTAKGERHGAVGVSSRHTLALVHHGGGSTRELLALAELLRERVQTSFGIDLELEPVRLGFDSH